MKQIEKWKYVTKKINEEVKTAQKVFTIDASVSDSSKLIRSCLNSVTLILGLLLFGIVELLSFIDGSKCLSQAVVSLSLSATLKAYSVTFCTLERFQL